MTEYTTTNPAPQHTSHTVIVPARLHHVNLKAVRFNEMRDFYTTLIGIHPTAEVGTLGWYTYDTANHRLALLHDPSMGERVSGTAGMHHMAFEYDTLDDLVNTYLRLKESDILPTMTMDHGMTTSFYYRDPDGNYIELQADNFGTDPSEGTAFMHSPAFQANPIGLPINMDTYVAAWRQGVSRQEMHRRAYAGEFAEGATILPFD